MNAHVRTLYVLDDPRPTSFAELAVVRSKVDLTDGTTRIAKGATGTIVHVYAGKDAYVVEFTDPQAVIGVHASDIVPA